MYKTLFWGFIIYYQATGYFWFRICGRWGLHFKNLRFHEPMFSESYGYQNFLCINHWIIKVLT